MAATDFGSWPLVVRWESFAVARHSLVLRSFFVCPVTSAASAVRPVSFAMLVTLVVLNSTTNHRRVKLHKTALLGRAADCALRIANDKVSRRHCELVLLEGVVEVRDLGSSNGTFLNGEQVPPSTLTRVQPDDELIVGSVRFRVEYEPAEVAAAPTPANDETIAHQPDAAAANQTAAVPGDAPATDAPASDAPGGGAIAATLGTAAAAAAAGAALLGDKADASESPVDEAATGDEGIEAATDGADETPAATMEFDLDDVLGDSLDDEGGGISVDLEEPAVDVPAAEVSTASPTELPPLDLAESITIPTLPPSEDFDEDEVVADALGDAENTSEAAVDAANEAAAGPATAQTMADVEATIAMDLQDADDATGDVAADDATPVIAAEIDEVDEFVDPDLEANLVHGVDDDDDFLELSDELDEEELDAEEAGAGDELAGDVGADSEGGLEEDDFETIELGEAGADDEMLEQAEPAVSEELEADLIVDEADIRTEDTLPAEEAAAIGASISEAVAIDESEDAADSAADVAAAIAGDDATDADATDDDDVLDFLNETDETDELSDAAAGDEEPAIVGLDELSAPDSLEAAVDPAAVPTDDDELVVRVEDADEGADAGLPPAIELETEAATAAGDEADDVLELDDAIELDDDDDLLELDDDEEVLEVAEVAELDDDEATGDADDEAAVDVVDLDDAPESSDAIDVVSLLGDDEADDDFDDMMAEVETTPDDAPPGDASPEDGPGFVEKGAAAAAAAIGGGSLAAAIAEAMDDPGLEDDTPEAAATAQAQEAGGLSAAIAAAVGSLGEDDGEAEEAIGEEITGDETAGDAADDDIAEAVVLIEDDAADDGDSAVLLLEDDDDDLAVELLDDADDAEEIVVAEAADEPATPAAQPVANAGSEDDEDDFFASLGIGQDEGSATDDEESDDDSLNVDDDSALLDFLNDG